MRFIKNIIIIAGVAFMMASCDSFLEKTPDNRTALYSKSAIQEILVTAYPDHTYSAFCETMSDNAGDKWAGGLPAGITESTFNSESYWWKDHTTTFTDSPENYWNSCYKAISHANLALEAIINNGDTEELQPLKGEALLARAYSHFMLVNLFAKHYDPETSKTDLGVPYVTTPENKVFVDYKREIVDTIYNRIEKDIEQAVKIIQNEYQAQRFHFTKNAANAFASRFYLYKGDWEKVVKYSNAYLGTDSKANLRDWIGKYAALSYEELQAEYTKSTEPANILLAHAYSQWQRTFITNRYSMNKEVSDYLYPQILKLPTKIFKFEYSVFGQSAEYRHVPKFKEFFNVTDANAGLGYPLYMVPLFTAEEVLFNRAEALVMLEKYTEATNDINAFHKKRLKTENYYEISEALLTNLYGANGIEVSPFYDINPKQTKYINYLLDLRRREFISEGMRWFDIRRFHIEITHKNVQGDKSVLTKDDLRREIQIPTNAISNGLKPNPR